MDSEQRNTHKKDNNYYCKSKHKAQNRETKLQKSTI